jgi:hypothetical protein
VKTWYLLNGAEHKETWYLLNGAEHKETWYLLNGAEHKETWCLLNGAAQSQAEHKKTWYTVNGTEQNKPINSFHDEIKIGLLRVLLAGNDCDGVGRVKVCARTCLRLLLVSVRTCLGYYI